MRTLTSLYDHYLNAEATVHTLVDEGVPAGDISIVFSGTDARDGEVAREKHGAATGAAVGTSAGAAAGLLAELALVSIPGFGPVLATGWFVAGTTVAGGALGTISGGLIAALDGHGVAAEHAQAYAEGIRRGGALVVVRVDDDIAQQTDDILHEYSRVDMEDRIRQYRAAGWEWSDDAVAPETTLRPKL